MNSSPRVIQSFSQKFDAEEKYERSNYHDRDIPYDGGT